jgi:hypothetical protein
MRRFKKNKRAKAALGIVVSLVVAGGAFAYWTGVGSGTGTGTVAPGGTITLTGTIAAGLAPGLNKAVSLTATNATTSAIKVGTVHLDSVAVDAAHATCVVADFTMADVPEDQSIAAASTNVALTNAGSLVFANTAANQDACKSATLTLTLSST